MSAPRQSQFQRSPHLQEEEPAVPLEPDVAKARSIYIRSNLDKIRAMKDSGKTEDEITLELPRFAKDFPSLFKMVAKSEEYNEGSLKTMVAMLERMGSGDLTQHQASVIVGQRLHDMYIKPRMPDMEVKEERQ
jgi:hypothetical protein